MLELKERGKFTNFQRLFLKLKKNHYFGRLGKVFQANDYFYFLDTGTGKVAKVNENVYNVLKCFLEKDDFESIFSLSLDADRLISALEEIKLAVEKEHILSAPLLEAMHGEAVSHLEDTVTTQMKGVTLELTEECNLRCKYCIYHPTHPSYREFGKKHMSFETAQKAIDMLKKHSNEAEETIYIGFYGGEPLMNFDVLKNTIEYANSLFSNRNIQYNLTTNATLLTREISDFLVEQKVTITFSLDGPKDLHDENREFINGKGSFDETIKGIERFVGACKNQNVIPRFMVNIVVSGPDYKERYEKIDNFIKQCTWYSDDIIIRFNMVDEGPQKSEYLLPQSEKEKEFTENMTETLGEWSDDKTNDYTENDDISSNATLNQDLIRIHKRQLVTKPTSQYSMNGCCVPGERKSYVSVTGDIFPCERIGDHIPPLGNVNGGFDVQKIKKYYVDDFIEKSKDACKNCWAINLCGLCYVNCYDEKGINIDYKNNLCLYERFSLEKSLIRYHKILEKNPTRLEMFNEMEVF